MEVFWGTDFGDPTPKRICNVKFVFHSPSHNFLWGGMDPTVIDHISLWGEICSSLNWSDFFKRGISYSWRILDIFSLFNVSSIRSLNKVCSYFFSEKRYSICIRQEEGFCCVEYRVCPDQLALLPGGQVQRKIWWRLVLERLNVACLICYSNLGSPLTVSPLRTVLPDTTTCE